MKYAVGIVFLIGACGGDAEPSPPPELYGDSLEAARQDIVTNPENCDSAVWDDLIADIGASEEQATIVLLALADACIEAGLLDSDYSALHGQALTSTPR